MRPFKILNIFSLEPISDYKFCDLKPFKGTASNQVQQWGRKMIQLRPDRCTQGAPGSDYLVAPSE